MQRIWKQKWLVVIGAVTIFLSIGAIAWAATDGQATGRGTTAVASTGTSLSTATADGGQLLGERPGAAAREAARARRAERLQRQQALMQALRGDMTPADQAQYDQLVAAAKVKREALQAAREDLAATLKQLRELTKKYLDANGAGGGG